jgi:hypothetical protein
MFRNSIMVAVGLLHSELDMNSNGDFGGLVVSVLASGTQDHAFLWRGSKAVCPMSHICGMLKTPGNYVEVRFSRRNLSAISHPFPFLTTRALSCRMTWSASGVDGQN